MKTRCVIHVVQHLRVRVRCERLRAPCPACHVPPVYMSEAAHVHLGPKPKPIVMQMLMKIIGVCRIAPAIVYVGCFASVALLRSHLWLGHGAQAGITPVTWQTYVPELCAAVYVSAHETTGKYQTSAQLRSGFLADCTMHTAMCFKHCHIMHRLQYGICDTSDS